MPPLLLHLRVPTKNGFFGIWLPYFLVYPLLLAIMILISPLVFLIMLFTGFSDRARPLLLAGPYLFLLLWRMKGLEIDIDGYRQKFMFSFV